MGYSDASFSNSREKTAQLGHTMFFCYGRVDCVPVIQMSYESKRITGSPMDDQDIDCIDRSNTSMFYTSQLNELLERNIPAEFLTDIKCLFDVISKGFRISENRMILNSTAAREAFRVR